MSIATEITSMETNLEDDYEGLINLGADLTGINKNILNIRTVLDNIYNDLPKVTGEGTELTFTPTRKGRLALVPKGNSTQESTEGKNKLENTATTQIINGITFTKNEDGTVLVNGTATSQANYYFNDNTNLTNGSYILNGCPSGGTSNTYMISLTNSSGGTNALDTGSGANINVTDTNKYSSIRIVVQSGTTVNNLLFKPMIRLATVTDATYEQFTGGNPAPSPEFPFPIKNVTGENEVLINNKNICNGTRLVGQNASLLMYFDKSFLTSNKLTISFITPVELSGNSVYFIYGEDTNGTYITGVSAEANSRVIKTITLNDARLELIKNNSPVGFRIYKNGANFTQATEIQIENGEVAETSYVPYQNQTKPLNLGNIELNGIGEYRDLIFKAVNGNPFYDSLTAEQKALLTYGKWYKHEIIGKYTLDGTENIDYQSPYSHFRIMGLNTGADISSTSQRQNIYSNYFANYYHNADLYIQVANNNTMFWVHDTNGYFNENANTFKTWLTTHNTVVYYKLATATDTELTDTTLISQLEEIDKMQSYNGTTIITSTFESSNAQMIINGSALEGI